MLLEEENDRERHREIGQDENKEVSCMTARIQWFSLADASLCCSVAYCKKFVRDIVPGPRAELYVGKSQSLFLRICTDTVLK